MRVCKFLQIKYVFAQIKVRISTDGSLLKRQLYLIPRYTIQKTKEVCMIQLLYGMFISITHEFQFAPSHAYQSRGLDVSWKG